MADQVAGYFSPYLRNKRFKATKPFIKGKTLDWGCGVGLLCESMAPEEYIGVDLDAQSIELACKRYPDRIFYSVDTFPRDRSLDTIIKSCSD